MDRPRCETCPYWDRKEPDDSVQGYCCRHAPHSRVTYGEEIPIRWPESDDEFGRCEPEVVFFPILNYCDFCGEHPDFPAYIASLKDAHPAIE